MSVQNIVDCIGHIACGYKKYANFFAEVFFCSINYLDPEKKLVGLHMFDGSSVCRKAQEILKAVYPMLSFIVGVEVLFKMWEYIEEITKSCR